MTSVIMLIVLSFLLKYPLLHDSRLFLIYYSITLLTLSIVIRIAVLRNIYLKYASSWLKKNVVIIGAGKAGKMVAAKLLMEKKAGVTIIGFLDDFLEVGTKITKKLDVIGKISNLKEVKNINQFSEVIIAIDNISYERLLEIIETSRSSNLKVKLASELFQIVPKKLIVDKYSDMPLVDLSERVSKQATVIFKAISDKLFAFLGLVLLSPFFVVIGIIIKISSKGPVLFNQIRIGKGGVPFTFYKFRSMEFVNGEDEDRKEQMIKFMKNGVNGTNGSTKVINESRVTKIGSFLRKTSLDELPQLINVLKGDMSLVGPRPCLKYEYDNYDEWQKKRLSIIPGCTGLWQVSGRSEVSFIDSVVLDIYYLNNLSPWLDLQIIFQTVPVMLFGKGGK